MRWFIFVVELALVFTFVDSWYLYTIGAITSNNEPWKFKLLIFITWIIFTVELFPVIFKVTDYLNSFMK